MLAAAVVAFRLTRLAFAKLETRAMPGFDIDLPAGRTTESGSLYRNGRLTLVARVPDVDDARKLLGRARCRKPGESSQKWPERPGASAR